MNYQAHGLSWSEGWKIEKPTDFEWYRQWFGQAELIEDGWLVRKSVKAKDVPLPLACRRTWEDDGTDWPEPIQWRRKQHGFYYRSRSGKWYPAEPPKRKLQRTRRGRGRTRGRWQSKWRRSKGWS